MPIHTSPDFPSITPVPPPPPLPAGFDDRWNKRLSCLSCSLFSLFSRPSLDLEYPRASVRIPEKDSHRHPSPAPSAAHRGPGASECSSSGAAAAAWYGGSGWILVPAEHRAPRCVAVVLYEGAAGIAAPTEEGDEKQGVRRRSSASSMTPLWLLRVLPVRTHGTKYGSALGGGAGWPRGLDSTRPFRRRRLAGRDTSGCDTVTGHD